MSTFRPERIWRTKKRMDWTKATRKDGPYGQGNVVPRMLPILLSTLNTPHMSSSKNSRGSVYLRSSGRSLWIRRHIPTTLDSTFVDCLWSTSKGFVWKILEEKQLVSFLGMLERT